MHNISYRLSENIRGLSRVCLLSRQVSGEGSSHKEPDADQGVDGFLMLLVINTVNPSRCPTASNRISIILISGSYIQKKQFSWV